MLGRGARPSLGASVHIGGLGEIMSFKGDNINGFLGERREGWENERFPGSRRAKNEEHRDP